MPQPWECAECRREIPAGQGPLCALCQRSHRGPVVVRVRRAHRPGLPGMRSLCPVCFGSATKGQNCRNCGVMISIE